MPMIAVSLRVVGVLEQADHDGNGRRGSPTEPCDRRANEFATNRLRSLEPLDQMRHRHRRDLGRAKDRDHGRAHASGFLIGVGQEMLHQRRDEGVGAHAGMADRRGGIGSGLRGGVFQGRRERLRYGIPLGEIQVMDGPDDRVTNGGVTVEDELAQGREHGGILAEPAQGPRRGQPKCRLAIGPEGLRQGRGRLLLVARIPADATQAVDDRRGVVPIRSIRGRRAGWPGVEQFIELLAQVGRRRPGFLAEFRQLRDGERTTSGSRDRRAATRPGMPLGLSCVPCICSRSITNDLRNSGLPLSSDRTIVGSKPASPPLYAVSAIEAALRFGSEASSSRARRRGRRFLRHLRADVAETTDGGEADRGICVAQPRDEGGHEGFEIGLLGWCSRDHDDHPGGMQGLGPHPRVRIVQAPQRGRDRGVHLFPSGGQATGRQHRRDHRLRRRGADLGVRVAHGLEQRGDGRVPIRPARLLQRADSGQSVLGVRTPHATHPGLACEVPLAKDQASPTERDHGRKQHNHPNQRRAGSRSARMPHPGLGYPRHRRGIGAIAARCVHRA